MAAETKIEWTDATWNPITGCSVVSPGCTNCYAMKLAGTRLQHHPSRAGLTVARKAGPVWTGKVRLNEQWLDQPLRWKRPRRIFVCAHGDLFHEGVPDEWIDRVFAVMALAPQHTFQVLTKRAERMRDYINGLSARHEPEGNMRLYPQVALLDAHLRGGGTLTVAQIASPNRMHWPLPNVWLGVSAEDQTRADERVPLLVATPAARRFISAEPLLGPLDLTRPWTGPGTVLAQETRPWLADLDWVIVGGESGPGARPMHPDWARSLRDQCEAAGVHYFFKQWGEWLPWDDAINVDGVDVMRAAVAGFGGDDPGGNPQMARVGKRAAGRLLDGRAHDATP